VQGTEMYLASDTTA